MFRTTKHWLSIGDKLPYGTYDEVYSKADDVINFVAGDMMVSIANTNIGLTPMQVTTNLFPIDEVKSFTLKENALIINEKTVYPYLPDDLYDGQVYVNDTNAAVISRRVVEVRKMLLQSKNKSMLKTLLDKDAVYTPRHVFEQKLMDEFRQAHNYLTKGNFASAVVGFKGRGYGFTPAGDDFNMGLLIGLDVRQYTGKKELSNIREFIYNLSRGNSLAVNTFLYMALHGYYNAEWKRLVYAVLSEHLNLKVSMSQVMKTGETSGADALTGFVSAWDIPLS